MDQTPPPAARSCRFLAAALVLVLFSGTAGSGPARDPAAEAALRGLLEQECVTLDKEKLFTLLADWLAADADRTMSPDLLRIMEGVIKRTDFDGIGEEKTAEIIGLVHGAYRTGAPLEYLDDIFDVAYVKTIGVDQLAAAANALKDLHRSDVPQGIFEEFVYHALEDGWDPAVVPVLTRGLIYGVERGLTPERVALIIMLDVKNGELGNKSPQQLVLDSLKLVRGKEPGRWKPMSHVEREMEAKQDRLRSLERRKQDIDDALGKRERAMIQAQAELKELREYPAGRERSRERERLERDLEAQIRKLQTEILKGQGQRRDIATELETVQRDVERRKASQDRERQQRREQELARKQQNIAAQAKRGRLDRNRLDSAVDRWVGTPYRFGGDSEQGIDCSAFTRRVYREQGVELPRTSREQARVGMNVAGATRTGDLIFFNTSINGVISHVGVDLGNNVFAHASSSKGVTKSSLKERYYAKRFVRGGRIFAD